MRTKFGVFLLSLLLTGTATEGSADSNGLPQSCGPNDVSFTFNSQKSAPPAASANQATLVVVQRAGLCIGCSVTRIGVDGAWVGANKGRTFFAVPIEAGEHHVCADWAAPLASTEARIGLTDFQAEPGKSYYFETVIERNGENEAPRMILKQLSPDMGAFLVARSEQSVAVLKSK